MISVQGLSKYYGEHAAIRDLSFSIAKGEVIGFLGLNGAGKSTTLKVLGCVLLPTSGQVMIDGLDLAEDPHEIRKRIGFLPETPPLYTEMTVGGYLSFVAQLRGVSGSETKARVEEAEAQTDLRGVHDQVIGSLSHGYKQRVGVAQALVHKPQLLILDEPTSGLDPVQIKEMRQLIRNLRSAHTILLSSHILSEISQTCDRLLVIHNGRIIAQGAEAEIARGVTAGGTSFLIEVRAAADKAAEVARQIPDIKSVETVRSEGDTVTLRLAGPSELRPAAARAFVQAGIDVLRLDRDAGQLESIFFALTQGGASA